MAKLIVTENGRDKIYEILDDLVIVGSGDQADLRFHDEGVAPTHFEIRRAPGGFRIVDLETREGTLVNGVAVNGHDLSNGDVIGVGDVALTYIGPGPERKAAPKRIDTLRPTTGTRRRRVVRAGQAAGKTGVLLALLAGAVVIVLMLKRASDEDPAVERLNAARTAVARVESIGMPNAREAVAAAYRAAESPEQRTEIAALERRLDDHEKRSRAAVSAVAPAGSRRADLESAVMEKIGQGDHQAAMALIDAVAPAERKDFGDALERLAARVRRSSRETVTARKQDIRDALRSGDRPAAESIARRVVARQLHATIADYLASPDTGYADVTNAAAEVAAMEILRAALLEARGR